MKKRRRLKKQVYYVLAAIIIFIMIIVGVVKRINYMNSYPYKLGKVGYDEKQIEIILTLKDNQIKDLLKRKYNKNIVSFVKQKYFIYKNLDRYLKYQKENKDKKLSEIIAMVNVNADYEWYDEDVIKETDLNQGYMMLVNKFYHLNEKYEPEDIVDIPITYAYDDNKISNESPLAKAIMGKKEKDKATVVVESGNYDVKILKVK